MTNNTPIEKPIEIIEIGGQRYMTLPMINKAMRKKKNTIIKRFNALKSDKKIVNGKHYIILENIFIYISLSGFILLTQPDTNALDSINKEKCLNYYYDYYDKHAREDKDDVISSFKDIVNIANDVKVYTTKGIPHVRLIEATSRFLKTKKSREIINFFKSGQVNDYIHVKFARYNTNRHKKGEMISKYIQYSDDRSYEIR